MTRGVRRTLSRIALAVLCVLVAAIASAQRGGQNEGIQVRGSWVIDVKNTDGSIASHHEFNNALSGGLGQGAGLIAGLLGRRYSAGTWYIQLNGTDIWKSSNVPVVGDGPCRQSSGNGGPCLIIETETYLPPPTSNGSDRHPFLFDTNVTNTGLRVTVPTGEATGQDFLTANCIIAGKRCDYYLGTLQLSGAVTATYTAPLTSVITGLVVCNPVWKNSQCQSVSYDVSPNSIGIEKNDGVPLTTHQLNTPVAVNAGQIIQVQVSFSFSTAGQVLVLPPQ